MKTKLLLILAILFVSTNIYSQASITNVAPVCTIDFSNSMQTSVGTNPSTAFSGAGFSPDPTVAGRLNSNAWQITGLSYSNLSFGGTQTLDEFSRGSTTTNVTTTGLYAFTEFPGTVANPSLMFQPGVSDFAPGSIVLKIKNNGTSNLTQVTVAYNILYRNDENRSSTFNFSYSLDNATYATVPALDFATPDVPDAFQWTNAGISPSRSTIITGLNIAPGGFIYIKWTTDDVAGTGIRDEIGLDDIVLTGYYGAPAPEINIYGSSQTILSGDTTPSVAEGTNYGIHNPPSSYGIPAPGANTQIITYIIQNLGGLPLNVTNITITGPNAANFVVGAITLPVTLSPLTQTNFVITFDPTFVGTAYAIVSIYSNDSDENPYTFYIQGDGYLPVPEIGMKENSPGIITSIINGSAVFSTLNNTLFTNQLVGGTGQNLQYKILNEAVGGGSTAQVLLTAPSPYITIGGVNPSDFTLTAIIPIANYINPGNSRTFEIKFLPTAPGVRTATISIPNNDSDENPYTFQVKGTGISPEIDITGNTQPIPSGSVTTSFANFTYFDNVNILTGIVDRTFTIQNNGTATLTIGTLTISGANASEFSVVTPPATSLAIGASTIFTIRFNPSTIGVKNATISIVNSDVDENPYIFAIKGYGVDYIPCNMSAIQTIAIQDFETAPASPTWNYSTTGTPTIAGGTAYGSSGDSGLSPRFLGAKSLQVSNTTSVITMANVDTSLYNDLELNLKLAALSATNSDGLDAFSDKVTIAVSTDGVSWSNELQVYGNNNSLWNFTSGTGLAIRTYVGDNIVSTFSPATAPSSVNYQTSNGFAGMILSGLPSAANLSIRITVVDNSNEIWALDNITLLGRKEITTTWNGATWTSGAPTSSIKAIIDGNFNTATNGNVSACKCEIKPSRNISIASDTFFDIESNLDNKGNVVIESGGCLVQRNDFAVNSGSLTAKRVTTPVLHFDYTYWSSPVSGQTLYNLSPNSSDKYFSFSPTVGNWIYESNANTMQIGKGYIIRAPLSFSTTVPSIYTGQFIGTPNNGFLQTPITVSTSDSNLIGNPYPSAIDADVFLSFPANVPVIGGTIYLWTHNTPITAGIYTANDYAVYNLVGGVGTHAINLGLNNTAPTGKIASGQGFFIQGLTTGQATFNNSMRVEKLNLNFFKSSSTTNTTLIEKHRFWLNFSNTQGAFKQMLVGYIQGATNELDRSFDGEVLEGESAISLYSLVDTKMLSIQGRALPFDLNDIVPLGYSTTIDGDFQINLDNFDGLMDTQDIFLEDKLLNITQNLKLAPYDFNTAVGTFNDRFQIRFTNTALSNNQFLTDENNVIVYLKDKKINVISSTENLKTILIYDMQGRKVSENNNLNNKEFNISNVVSGHQTLLIKIVLENGNVVTKKIVY